MNEGLGHARNPYDDVPYRSLPIEWTAPERLALTSMLHGGPRLSLGSYRVLELGCGDGSNLLPLAYYRRNATFVGVDASAVALRAAKAHQEEAHIANVGFLHADILTADALLEGTFDIILAHGVLSWVPADVRDALLGICARRLAPGGLVYLNYNALPGWNVRGMVRDFLLAQTAGISTLRERTTRAQEAAAAMAASFGASVDDHPYSRLMERDFRFVVESDPTYVAHEFLSTENHAYWRSDFTALTARYGLTHVAEADFNYPWSRVPDGLSRQLAEANLRGRSADDTLDLVSYRQLCSPILTHAPFTPVAPSHDELSSLIAAASLAPLPHDGSGTRLYRHASGFEVEAKDGAVGAAFERLAPLWPRGLPMRELFADTAAFLDDFRLLHRHGLLDLRLCEPAHDAPPSAPLNACEARWGGYATSPYHVRSAQQ